LEIDIDFSRYVIMGLFDDVNGVVVWGWVLWIIQII